VGLGPNQGESRRGFAASLRLVTVRPFSAATTQAPARSSRPALTVSGRGDALASFARGRRRRLFRPWLSQDPENRAHGISDFRFIAASSAGSSRFQTREKPSSQISDVRKAEGTDTFLLRARVGTSSWPGLEPRPKGKKKAPVPKHRGLSLDTERDVSRDCGTCGTSWTARSAWPCGLLPAWP